MSAPESAGSEPTDIPDEYWGVVIEDETTDGEPLASLAADAPDAEADSTRQLVLTRGGATRNTDRSFEVQRGEDGNGTRINMMVTPDEFGGIALYIGMLEQHGYEEPVVMDAIRNQTDINFDDYLAWLDDLSERDRRLRLLDQAEERAETAPHVESYLARGSWRSTPVSDTDTPALATRLARSLDVNPRSCYRNAYLAKERHRDNHRVQYVEGLALGRHPGRISTHAWIEIDDAVVELTWPWNRPTPADDAIYFGVPVDFDEVEATAKRREAFGPVLLADDRLDELNQ